MVKQSKRKGKSPSKAQKAAKNLRQMKAFRLAMFGDADDSQE